MRIVETSIYGFIFLVSILVCKECFDYKTRSRIMIECLKIKTVEECEKIK